MANIISYLYVKNLLASRSSVVRLFLRSGPFTVLSTVRSIVVHTVNRCVSCSIQRNVLKIRGIHIVPKLLKRVPQKLDSSTTVSRVTRVGLCVASTFRACVDFVEHGIALAMRVSKFYVLVFKKTSARTSVSASKIPRRVHTLFSAIALTHPQIGTAIRFICGKFTNNKSSVPLSSYINHDSKNPSPRDKHFCLATREGLQQLVRVARWSPTWRHFYTNTSEGSMSTSPAYS